MTPDCSEKLDRLRAGTLDPAEFSHLDHIGVAYEAITRYDFLEAARIVADGIRHLAEAAGDPMKFNATITLAFMSVIAERMGQARYADAAAFIEDNPDLATRAALAPWYSAERLTSDLARSVLLLPDRVPERV